MPGSLHETLGRILRLAGVQILDAMQKKSSEELAMRLLLLAAAAFISFCSVPAQAQRAPYDMWCRDERIGPGPFDTVMRCEAYTYQQCMASRTSFGACYQNPRYDARFAKPKQRPNR
jgi:hypothetical protein